MHWYRYRHIEVILLILILLVAAYFLDLRPLQEEYNELLANESELSLSLTAAQTAKQDASQKSVIIPAKSALLRELMQLLHLQNINIISLVEAPLLDGEVNDGEYFQLKLRADYLSWLRLLRSMAAQKAQYVFRHLAMEITEQDELNVELILRVRHSALRQVKQDRQDQQDQIDAQSQRIPFCSDINKGMTPKLLADQLLHYPLNELRLLGLIEHRHEKAGLIMFPNGIVEAVNLNAELGSEHARVSQLSSAMMILRLPDKSSYILPLIPV